GGAAADQLAVDRRRRHGVRHHPGGVAWAAATLADDSRVRASAGGRRREGARGGRGVRHTARWTAITVGVVVLLFVGLLATRKSADTTHADSPLLGKAAPATSGVSFSGPSGSPGVALSGFKGKY